MRRVPVTAGLLGVCIVLYAITFIVTLAHAPDPLDTALRSVWSLSLEESTDVFRQLGALELSRIWLDGEWWRVVTTGLLHGSLLHLVLNSIALLSVGEWVEQAWGHLRALALFTLASIGGALASLAWCESPIVLGASGGILGQAGALWLARRWGSAKIQEILEPISPTSLGILIVICLALGLAIPGIAQAGHLGGLAAGLLLGAAWVARARPLKLALSLALALFLGGLAWLGAQPTHRTNYYAILGFRMLADDHPADALILFNRGLERDPENANFRNAVAYQLALDGVELERAETLSLGALQPDSLNASYLDTLGWIWCRRGLADSGTRVLHAAGWLAREPFPELAEHLAGCATAAADVPRGTLEP
ncbi:rhomboid family intramembrane serine protease [Nannocystis radixulma]|uniref:Rhomboid family intramembrane serine protease n=1 Tax=Nannocystis radixulma TaxID=2995305 RepID=A0ABT5BAZ2_9BACT|nr:rhomboid family intramembrane serine protease [Nannocystis radixulma]MDC0671300.1 rhomboid family intramembrane serine protease [Nannocystis radixulma]